MAKKLFKGFQLVVEQDGMSFAKDYLYFVRTNSGKTDGYLYLNGKKYGTAEDVKNELLGEIEEGDLTTIKALSDAVKALEAQGVIVSTGKDKVLSVTSATTESGITTFTIGTALGLDLTDDEGGHRVLRLLGKEIEVEGEEPTREVVATLNVDEFINDCIKEVVVNGVSAETVNHTASVTIDSADIAMASSLIYSGETVFDSGDTIDEAFEAIADKMIENEKVTAAALNDLDKRLKEKEEESSEITSTGKTISVSATTESGKTTTNIDVNLEEASDETVAAGHIELQKNENGALYAVMYIFENDVEEKDVVEDGEVEEA